MRIAVTGGSGEMGRSLVPYLIQQGHTVVSVDRALPPGTLAVHDPELTYLAADTRNFGEVAASLHNCEAVVHLAAHRAPGSAPNAVVYVENTAGSYHVLEAAAMLGIQRVCLASSINAIGGAFSRSPRYDYFPLDEQHPTYAEDPYSLSKWVLEQQADAYARRYAGMRIASLRFHWLVSDRQRALELSAHFGSVVVRHLWAYTLLSEANRACLLALTADFAGHEAFYITAPRTVASEPSIELARQHYPATAIRGDWPGQASFFDCAKAARLLGWQHED